MDGATIIGTGTVNASGQASFSTLALSVGSHSITAVYSGDGNFNGSTSAAVNQTVNKASTTTSISSSQNPSVFGQPVTFTAVVSVVMPGSGTATGTVTFMDGATTLGTGTLNASGQASFTTSSLSVGSHSISAVYAGDSNFYGSTSSTLSQGVNKATSATTIGVIAPEPSLLLQPYTVNFSVAAVAPGAGTPTGTVTVSDGSATCIGTLSMGSGACTLTSTTVGAKTLTATYSGDTNFLTSPGSKPHNVVYTFIGFLQPIDNRPAVNIGNPGRTYPVKWQLKDASGNYISSLASVASIQYTTVSCAAFDMTLSDVIEAAATGGTVLRYDATANQFIYNWQTPTTSNACYTLTVTLNDGTKHQADFQMKK
jgi:hypothetical protein